MFFGDSRGSSLGLPEGPSPPRLDPPRDPGQNALLGKSGASIEAEEKRQRRLSSRFALREARTTSRSRAARPPRVEEEDEEENEERGPRSAKRE